MKQFWSWYLARPHHFIIVYTTFCDFTQQGLNILEIALHCEKYLIIEKIFNDLYH